MQIDAEAAAINSEYVGLSVMEFLKALILEGQDKKVTRTGFFFCKRRVFKKTSPWTG
jgi:hypothetical protein